MPSVYENKCFVVSPSLSLVEFVGELLLQKKFIAKSLVVFPGKRPAYFLRKYLEKNKENREYPVVFSQDEFIDYLYDIVGYKDTKIKDIDSIGILYKITNERQPLTKVKLDEFLALGYKLFSTLEEMQQEMLDPEKIKFVEDVSSVDIPDTIINKLSSLSGFYTLFYEYLEKNNISTRSSRYRKVAENADRVNLDSFSNIYLCGFFALTYSEQKIFSFLAGKDNVRFVFQKGPNIENIIGLLKLKYIEIGKEPEQPTIFFHRASDTHSEIFSLNKTIFQKSNFKDEVIVLPLPEPLLPLLQHTLPLVGPDYNISVGYPLSQTPVYSLIKTLERVFEKKEEDKFFLKDYLNFVLHPYVKNIYFEELDRSSYPTRIILHTIEKIFVDKEKIFVELKEIEEDEDVLNSCINILQKFHSKVTKHMIVEHLKNIHQKLIKPFENILSIDDFACKILDFLSFISQKSTVHLHPMSSEFIKAMQDAVEEIRNSQIKNETLSDLPGYFKFLKNFIQTIYHPFSGMSDTGLQILGVLETRCLKFKTVYFLDLNEGVIPSIRKEDTFFPFEIRKYLHLPTSEDREKISRYLFETLIYGAEEVHLFYLENKDKEKSRYVEKLIWDIQRKTGCISLPREEEISFGVSFIQKNPEEVKKTQEIISYLEKLNFSPTLLDTYLYCPLKFYYTYVLGLSSQKDISESSDKSKIGEMVHSILSNFFKKKVGKKLSIEEDNYSLIKKMVYEEFKKRHLFPDKGISYLIRAQIDERMKDILDFHREKYKDIVILECDEREHSIWITLPSGKKVVLCGKFDRIDKREDGVWIVDYKTGSIANLPTKFLLQEREKWQKTLKSTQLPMYLIIYLGERQDIKEDRINAEILLLGERNIKNSVLFEIGERGKFAEYREAIITLIEEILSPDISFKPTFYPDDICPRCDFNVMCGRQWIGY